MSLTGQLRNLNSPVSRFFEEHLDWTAAKEFVEAQNAELVLRPPIVTAGANPSLVGNAFCYLFRWTVAPLRTNEIVSYHGAKNLHLSLLHKEIVNHGYSQPHTRPVLAVILALFEEVYRRKDVHPILAAMAEGDKDIKHLLPAVSQDVSLRASMEDVATLGETIPSVWGTDLTVRRAFKASPTFSGSRDVGGADANWLLNGTLWDSRCTRLAAPFTLENLQQQIGYALLDYGDDLNIEQLGWYYVRQRCRLVYPINALVRDIKDLRSKFRAAMRVDRVRIPFELSTYFVDAPDDCTLLLED